MIIKPAQRGDLYAIVESGIIPSTKRSEQILRENKIFLAVVYCVFIMTQICFTNLAELGKSRTNINPSMIGVFIPWEEQGGGIKCLQPLSDLRSTKFDLRLPKKYIWFFICIIYYKLKNYLSKSNG